MHDRPLRKIHDLSELVKDCMRTDVGFVEVRTEARLLNPFVTLYRYPDIAFPYPDKVLLGGCLQYATVVLSFVKGQITIR